MCVFRLFAAARPHHSKHCAKLLQHHDFLLWKIDVASCLMRGEDEKVNHDFNNTWRNEAGGLAVEAKMKFMSFYWSCMHLHGGKNSPKSVTVRKLFHRFIFCCLTKMFSRLTEIQALRRETFCEQMREHDKVLRTRNWLRFMLRNILWM